MSINVNLRWMILALVLAMVASDSSARSVGNGGTLTGVIKDASGNPVAGALVKVRNADKRFSFMVASQDKGRYKITNLPPGKYTIQGLGGNLQSDVSIKAGLEVANGQTMTVDVALTTPISLSTLTSAQYAALVPEGPGKTLLKARCTSCHFFEKFVPYRKTREGWLEIVEKMRNHPFGSRISAEVTDRERDEIVAYLTKDFGPDVPLPNLERDVPKIWLKGASTKFVAMEYEIPKGAYPHDHAVDSKGIVWVAEANQGNLGRFDPNSLTYTRIPLPPIGAKKFHLFGAAVDNQDRIWVSDQPNRRMVAYDQKSETFTSFNMPKPSHGQTDGNTIRFGSDGSVWMTESGADQILRLHPPSKEFTAYAAPSADLSYPYGMTIDSDGFVWFAEHSAGKIARLDPATGKTTEYDLPTPENLRPFAGLKGWSEIHNLRRMGTDAKGDIWYAGYGLSNLGMIDHKSGKITEYPTPTLYAGPYSVDVDKTRNLIWFVENWADQVARFDPKTKTFVEFPLPAIHSHTRRVNVDPIQPNRVWYSSAEVDTIGYIQVIE